MEQISFHERLALRHIMSIFILLVGLAHDKARAAQLTSLHFMYFIFRKLLQGP
jgi:hypothetical protein